MENKKSVGGRKVSPEQQYIRDTIVRIIRKNGSGISSDFIQETKQSDNDVRRALRFLKKNGIIIDTGRRMNGGVGHPPIVWKLV